MALNVGADSAVRDEEEIAVNTAISKGQVEIVQALLDAGLSPNAGADMGEMQPLLVASYGESTHAIEIVDILINADVNGTWGEDGETPLTTTIQDGGYSYFTLDILQRLIGAGADLDQPRNDGFRPLQLAASLPETTAARMPQGAPTFMPSASATQKWTQSRSQNLEGMWR